MKILSVGYSYLNQNKSDNVAFKANLSKADDLSSWLVEKIGQEEADAFFSKMQALDRKIKKITGKLHNGQPVDVRIMMAPNRAKNTINLGTLLGKTAWRYDEDISLAQKGVRLARKCYRAMKRAPKKCLYD